MDFKEILNKVTAFLQEGYNLYYVIGAAVLLVAVIVIAVAVSKKKKNAPVHEAALPAEEAAVVPEPAEIAAPKQDIIAEKKVHPSEKLNQVVPVTPVVKKEKPVPPPEPAPAPVKAGPTAEEIAAAEESKLKRPGVIQIYKDTGDKFRFRLKASNNETVGHSQGYTTKAACKNGIKAVQNIIAAETYDTTKNDYKPLIGVPAFEIYKDSENKFRFRLRAANTSNILASQGYTSKDNCLNGIRSVKHIAANYALVDDTLEAKESKEA